MKARTRTRRPPDLALACALAATVAGCDTDPGAKVVQRDVYQSLSDCVIDWGSVDLCQQQMADDATSPRRAWCGGQCPSMACGRLHSRARFPNTTVRSLMPY